MQIGHGLGLLAVAERVLAVIDDHNASVQTFVEAADEGVERFVLVSSLGVYGSQDLAKNSPLAMHVTLEHLRRSAKRDLRETLIADYHLACRFLDSEDFSEGVRAMLIDKTRDAKWQHEDVSEVTETEVGAFFKKGDEQGFQLPTKDQVEFN